MNPVRIGLTGGIGSGKSTVAQMLADRGAAIIDADAISRACTAAGGSAIATIAQRVGADFITAEGALDRERMRAHVFAQPSARQQLEAIIHPRVAEETRRQAQDAQARGHRVLVFDVPLLVESGRWRSALDRVLVVDCLEETQITRVMARNHWTREAVQAVLNAQASRAQRLAAADWVIFNDGLDLETLRREVNQLPWPPAH